MVKKYTIKIDDFVRDYVFGDWKLDLGTDLFFDTVDHNRNKETYVLFKLANEPNKSYPCRGAYKFSIAPAGVEKSITMKEFSTWCRLHKGVNVYLGTDGWEHLFEFNGKSEMIMPANALHIKLKFADNDAQSTDPDETDQAELDKFKDKWAGDEKRARDEMNDYMLKHPTSWVRAR